MNAKRDAYENCVKSKDPKCLQKKGAEIQQAPPPSPTGGVAKAKTGDKKRTIASEEFSKECQVTCLRNHCTGDVVENTRTCMDQIFANEAQFGKYVECVVNECRQAAAPAASITASVGTECGSDVKSACASKDENCKNSLRSYLACSGIVE